jgi:peroxiredoxin
MEKLERLEDLPLLREALEAEAQKVAELYPQDVMEVVLESIKTLASSELMEAALKTGDTFPHFLLPNIDGTTMDLNDLLARGPVVINFIRGGWCGYCNLQMRMIRKYVPHFEARGATVIAISPETVGKSRAMAKEGGLTFPILYDSYSELAQECNIAYELGDALKQLLGPSVAGGQGNYSFVIPIPATYVVGTNGKIIYSFVEANFTQRAEPLDIIHTLPKLKRNNWRYLKEKLDIELAKLRDIAPEQTMADMFDEINAIEKSGIIEAAVQTGQNAPDWILPNKDGKMMNSKKIRKDSDFLIVAFYRGMWCPFHVIFLSALQRFLPQFESKGAKVLAVSPQSVEMTAKTASQNGITFPLYSDGGNHVANSFRLAHAIDANQLLCGQRSMEEFNDNNSRTLPSTAVYLMDRKGMILYSYVSCDFTKGPEPMEILAAIPSQKVHDKPRIRRIFSMNLKSFLPGGRKQVAASG